ncbi:hypothetical protein GR294_25565 [Raoultella sp. Lac2]|uniref:hypothetical protein n=1 Tax=unclassified Raoultella TaxID=2627600 RepID=UPI0013542958|nr:hypothetical protein [Raoultella sp. Lac2]MXF99215.1 hypothetical protein [Raoultella sp. Lac1]
MKTTSLLLDVDTWDLTVDELGNIATVDNPYACAQDVATACLAIRGECIYEKDTGVNYKELLNVKASTGAMAAALQTEALRMNYIAQAEATLVNDRDTRRATGVITIVDTNGLISKIAL